MAQERDRNTNYIRTCRYLNPDIQEYRHRTGAVCAPLHKLKKTFSTTASLTPITHCPLCPLYWTSHEPDFLFPSELDTATVCRTRPDTSFTTSERHKRDPSPTSHQPPLPPDGQIRRDDIIQQCHNGGGSRDGGSNSGV